MTNVFVLSHTRMHALTGSLHSVLLILLSMHSAKVHVPVICFLANASADCPISTLRFIAANHTATKHNREASEKSVSEIKQSKISDIYKLSVTKL